MSKLQAALICIALCGIGGLIFYLIRSRDPNLVKGYSATITDRDLSHPEDTSIERIYVNTLASPRGIRIESTSAGRQRISISSASPHPHVVLDPATGTFWYPQTHAFLRAFTRGPDDPKDPDIGGEKATRRYLGYDTVSGRKAKHWEISEPTPTGNPFVWQYWEDARLGIALKWVKPDQSSCELTDIREGAQPASLFQAPPGFREVPAPNP